MLSKAKAKYVRMSARKVRLVLELVKGKTVENAGYVLDNVNKRAGRPIKKVIDSAFANLNFGLKEKMLEKDVYISNIKAEGGPMLTRYRAATMGRAAVIRHRTVHIGVELDKVIADNKKQKQKQKSGE